MCENVCVCARVLAMNVGTRLPSRSPPSRLLEIRREWTEAEAEIVKGRGARERGGGGERDLPALACAYLHVSACARAHVWYCEWPVWHEHMVMYARLLDD